LHCAAGNGHKDVVEFLLAHGTDVNVKNSSGETPLHLAALIGNKDVVEFLLTHGADVSATDAFGYTPLKHAENKDIADILLSHMSDANVKDKVFNQYISDLQNTPGDNHLREVIIALAQKEKLVPDVPAEANADFIKANTFMKAAKNTSDYKYAIEAYKKALLEAPWWGNAYYNLGMALEAAGQNDDAVESLKLYILTKSSEADIAQTKTKIIEIQAKGELAEKKEADLRAKYGGNDAPGSFNFDSLFRYGAVVQDMSFDASGSARTISLKIQTRKENGRLLNYLAIFDITSKEDTFGQTFSADWRGTQTFYGDDRTRPGKYSMTLTVTSFGDGDAKISIRPSNNASASIQTTLADLFRERARQAVYGGQQDVKVGDKTFYVIGEGGSKQALLYFPAEIKDKLEHGEVRDLSPMFVAIVNYRGPDGKSKAFAKSDLGIVNGTHYHLELDENDVWTAKIGEGPAN
jgi:tetratricopeptide (TPR) repeat protein